LGLPGDRATSYNGTHYTKYALLKALRAPSGAALINNTARASLPSPRPCRSRCRSSGQSVPTASAVPPGGQNEVLAGADGRDGSKLLRPYVRGSNRFSLPPRIKAPRGGLSVAKSERARMPASDERTETESPHERPPPWTSKDSITRGEAQGVGSREGVRMLKNH
jgi:hypothetical protein